jgi:hypothetical protein
MEPHMETPTGPQPQEVVIHPAHQYGWPSARRPHIPSPLPSPQLTHPSVLVIPAIYLAFLGVPILLAWFLRGLACCFGGTYREGRYRTQRLLDLDERGKRAQSFFWCWGRCFPCLFLRKRVAREEKEREWDGRLVDGEDGMDSMKDVERK